MTARRLSTVLLGLLLVAAAAVCAIALNILLLDRAAAGNDPVGRLAPGTRVVPAAPSWTLRPRTGPIEDRGADD